MNGRRETLVIGRYDPSLPARKAREAGELSFGMSVGLAEARLLLAQARRAIQCGDSPSRSKVETRVQANEALTFGNWAEKYFAEAALAESTRSMRKSVYERKLETEFGRLKLEEITPARLMARCEKIKERGASAQALHTWEIVPLSCLSMAKMDGATVQIWSSDSGEAERSTDERRWNDEASCIKPPNEKAKQNGQVLR